MKHNMLRKLIFVSLAAVMFMASGCEDDVLTKIQLSQPKLTLLPGDVSQLEVSVEPVSSRSSLEWSSLNPSVATVENGCVTAVSAGETFVIATVGSFSKGCLVIVNDRKLPGYDDTDYEWKD